LFIEDKKPEEQSIKEQINREYKEIDECKKGFKKEKKDNKAKMVSTEHKPKGLDHIISSNKQQQKKGSEKFASMPNESIISTDTVFKWLNIQSRIINGKIPIIAKLVLSLGFCFYRQLRFQNLKNLTISNLERINSSRIYCLSIFLILINDLSGFS